MRISPVNVTQNYQSKNVYRNRNVKQTVDQPSFQGVKGAGVGAGIGLLWSGAALAICAVGAPYLLPLIAGDVIIGGAGAGAVAGHFVEKEGKK